MTGSLVRTEAVRVVRGVWMMSILFFEVRERLLIDCMTGVSKIEESQMIS